MLGYQWTHFGPNSCYELVCYEHDLFMNGPVMNVVCFGGLL